MVETNKIKRMAVFERSRRHGSMLEGVSGKTDGETYEEFTHLISEKVDAEDSADRILREETDLAMFKLKNKKVQNIGDVPTWLIKSANCQNMNAFYQLVCDTCMKQDIYLWTSRNVQLFRYQTFIKKF